MKEEFRIELLKKLSEYSIGFKDIEEFHYKLHKKKLPYNHIYNVLKGLTKDKNQRVLDAVMETINAKKKANKEAEEKIKSL